MAMVAGEYEECRYRAKALKKASDGWVEKCEWIDYYLWYNKSRSGKWSKLKSREASLATSRD